MAKPRTTPIGAALVITFVCFLLQPTPSAAADSGSLLQGLWARAEAILSIFVAPHAGVSSRSGEPVATRKTDREGQQDEHGSEAAPPPSRYLMDMNPNGEAAPPPSRYLMDMNADG